MDEELRRRLRGSRGDYLGPMVDPFSRPAPPPRPMPSMQPQPVIPRAEPRLAKPARTPKIKNRRIRKERKASSKKRLLLFMLFLVFLLAGGAAAGFVYMQKRSNKVPASTAQNQNTSDTSTSLNQLPEGKIRLIATGDFAAYDSINKDAKQADGSLDYLPMMSGIKDVMSKGDIRVCSQSTPGGGTKHGVTGYPNFNAPVEWSKGLLDVGCNVIDVASEHTNDKGQAAIKDALNFYDDKSGLLAVSGANRGKEERDKIRYFEVKQVKFAFLSYTTKSQKAPEADFSLNVYKESIAKIELAEARKNANFIIVSMTWGKEDSADVQADQEAAATFLANHGADLIIGNGPHIPQPAKIITNTDGHQTLVWFSLGNAVNSQLPLENLIGGLGIVDIDIPTQDMVDPGVLPVYMHYEWTAAQKAAGTLDARHDFGLFVLDQAADKLAKSQNKTTVKAETARLKAIFTKFLPIKMLTSNDF